MALGVWLVAHRAPHLAGDDGAGEPAEAAGRAAQRR
jgi:hypothetical protein